MNKQNENVCCNCLQDGLMRQDYCVTAVDCATTVQKSIASNENYVKLNVILHQKSKFLNTIACCLVVDTLNKTKNFE